MTFIHSGASGPSGMKIPDRNSRGRMIALTIAGAASAFGTIAVVASPSAENAIAPTTTVTMCSHRSTARRDVGLVEGDAERGRDDDQEDRDQHRVVTRARRGRCRQAAGVPRVRFRIPASRVKVTLIARFVYVAVITANAAIAAT